MNSLIDIIASEKKAIKQIEKKQPQMSRIFREKLPEARKRVLQQLAQAVIREELAKYFWKKDEDQLEAVIHSHSGGNFIIPIAKRHMLGHLEIGGEIYYQASGKSTKINHPSEFAKLLNLGAEDSNFIEELENSVVNYTFALVGAQLRKQNLLWKDDFYSFLLENKKLHNQFSPLVCAEQWVIEGHTLHPCTKTRLGLSLEEVIKYSPEWAGTVDLVPVAVNRKHMIMKFEGNESMTQILFKEYPFVEKNFKDQLPNGGKDYEIIPVHPWQLEHTIKPHLKTEIAQGVIVPLKNTSMVTSALLSFRSLAPVNSRKRHHFKTAVDVQMTSAKRTVSPTSVHNGPVISAILKNIESTDPLIGNGYQFLAEIAGGHYLSLKADHDSFMMKNLSALLRQNPEQDLARNEIALPAACLISRSPFTGKLILHELVESFSHNNKIDVNSAALQYMQSYAELLLPGLLALIAKYGISLEAHLQNTVPVFIDGLPVRFLFRDNGGIRIKEERLFSRVGKSSIDNKTNLLTKYDQDLFTMFSHAILHNHLGEMVHHLANEMEVKDNELWKPIRKTIFSSLDQLKQHENSREGALLLEKEMMAPTAPLKALVKMRLSDQYTENMYTFVRNPLMEDEEGDKNNGL